MTPRTILYTGKGGVGKTSVAAATARACAARGHRTLVVSTDPAHSLGDSLGVPLGAEAAPVPDTPGLHAQQISAQVELERNWSGVSGWLAPLLADKGVNRIAAEELTVPPGTDELFSLLTLKGHAESGLYDVIVVDCAPTGETLRLLSFPDVARWWLDKVFGREAHLVAAARPLARAFLDIELPDERVFEEVQQLIRNLVVLNDLLRDTSRTTIRLVMNPERMVIDEAMRTFTYVNLYGFLCDAVVVNRVFPPELDGTYLGGWRQVQQEHLELVESGFAPVPVLQAPLFALEVIGPERLDELAGHLYAGVEDPAAVLYDSPTQELVPTDDGGAKLWIALPFVAKGEVSVKKVGLRLVVRVGDAKRTIQLPPAMASHRPAGAAFADGVLEVTFTSSPAPAHV